MDVAKRLHLRSMEIEEAILARIRTVASDPIEDGDIQYEEGSARQAQQSYIIL
jgi:hypothetical protein